MRFIFELGSKIMEMVQNLKISSANPTHINRVLGRTNLNVAGLTDSMRDDVVRIIQDEIKIQMTTVGEDMGNVPKGSQKSKEAVSLARQGVGIAQNPASIVQMGLRVLPHAALVAFAIQMAPLILEFITRPGGPMDVRWKRQIEAEMNGFMDRQTQRNSQIGTRAISIQSRAGFIGINGANNSNNLREIREGGVNKDRLARIDIFDHTKGYFN